MRQYKIWSGFPNSCSVVRLMLNSISSQETWTEIKPQLKPFRKTFFTCIKTIFKHFGQLWGGHPWSQPKNHEKRSHKSDGFSEMNFLRHQTQTQKPSKPAQCTCIGPFWSNNYIDEKNISPLPSEEIEFNINWGRSESGPYYLFILRQFRESNPIIGSQIFVSAINQTPPATKTTENSRKLTPKDRNECQISQLGTCAEHGFERDSKKLSSWGLGRFRGLCTFSIDRNASNDVSEHQIRCCNEFETFLPL